MLLHLKDRKGDIITEIENKPNMVMYTVIFRCSDALYVIDNGFSDLNIPIYCRKIIFKSEIVFE